MRDNAVPVIVWAELPTPDVVVVQHATGAVTVLADPAVSPAVVEAIAAHGVADLGVSRCEVW